MNNRTAVLMVALGLLTVFATAFALINYSNTVKVWPLMSYYPLTLVIGVSFLLGAVASSLLVSLLTHHRAKLPATSTLDVIPPLNAHAREQAGRI